MIASTIAILRVFWFHRLDRKKELLLKIQSKNGLLPVPCSVAEIARYERYITANESSPVGYFCLVLSVFKKSADVLVESDKNQPKKI